MADSNFRKLTDRILDIFFPPRCAGCGEPISLKATDAFCPDCRKMWDKHKKEKCNRCGQPMDRCWCGVSGDTNGYITNEYHLVQYDKTANTVIKSLLYNLKNFSRHRVYDTIAAEMYKELLPRVDYSNLVICYVPRSAVNVRKFGHDQSLNIARSLSRLCEIDIADILVNNSKANQKTLTIEERRFNASKSYNIRNGSGELIKNKNVILIDDVLTTGSSVIRCAQLLKSKGAKRVIVFTIAKTVQKA